MTNEIKSGSKLPFKFDKEVKWILGRPNFVCGPIARILRAKDTLEIKTKAEDEQAAVIYWMLEMYMLHGEKWREEAEKELNLLKPKS